MEHDPIQVALLTRIVLDRDHPGCCGAVDIQVGGNIPVIHCQAYRRGVSQETLNGALDQGGFLSPG